MSQKMTQSAFKVSLALLAFSLLLSVTGVVNAAFTSMSATLNGSAPPIIVGPGASITVAFTVRVTASGNNNWQATRWQIDSGATTCINHADHPATGTFVETFTITGPTAIGNHDLRLRAYTTNDCSGAGATTLTLNNAINIPNPAGDLDQCANGGVGDPPIQCTGSAWQNGNLNGNQAHYREDDSVPYRIRLSNIATSGTHTLVIEWDTTQSGKHAIDYLTSFDRTETTAAPCSGVAGCGSPTTFSIPVDPNVTKGQDGILGNSDDIVQAPGNFTCFNCTITSASAYTLSGTYGGNSSTRITISFTASNSTPVIAWSGHIASQIDWGIGNSASAISGAPYHMRLISIDGGGGNQDRSLASGAIPPIPGLTTQASASTISLGQSVTDTATFTEVGSNGPVTGTVKFFVCGPFASATACATGGTQVGGAITIAGNSATSAAFAPDTTGTYCFRAEYTPDTLAKYSPINHTNTTTECFTVVKASPAINTTPDPASGPTGTTLNDTATLSGGFTPTGTITFNLYDSNDATCSGAPAFTQTVVVSGNNVYSTSGGFVANMTGTWRWTAGYSGDSKNNAAASGCDAELVTIGKATPGLTTSPNPTSTTETSTLNDSATLSGGFNPTGTITFNLYDPDQPACAGTPRHTETVAVTGNGTYSTTAGFAADKVGTWRWVATYSGDSGNNAVTGGCDDEQVTVADVLPTVALDKSATPLSLPEPGGPFTFTLTITNTSVETVTITALTDTNGLGGTCPALIGTTLAAGASTSCTYTVTHTQPGQYDNTATVTVKDDENNLASASDDATVVVDNLPSSIMVTKTADPINVPEPGGTVTFTVRVDNTSAVDSVTIASLMDDVHGDLGGQGDCSLPQTIPAGGYYECSFADAVSGNPGYSETDTVTASGTDDDGEAVSAQDSATVTIADVPSSISVVKDASPASLPEPGGPVMFSVTVNNISPVDSVTINTLVDSIHGDLNGNGTCSVPQTIPVGGSYSCAFTASVTGNAGHVENDVVTATGVDDDGQAVSHSDDATVTLTDVPSSITVDKTANPTSLDELGGLVTFTVTVNNTSAVDTVTITSLIDSIHNDLNGQETCSTPQTIPAGDSYTCTFTASVTGNAAYVETDVVTASGADDDGQAVSANDDAVVTITNVPSSISVTKTANPTSVDEPGGSVTFTVRVDNTSAVDSVTITSLTDTAYGNLDGTGTCTLPQTIAAGGFYECAFTVTVSGNGGSVHTNVATASGTDDDGEAVSDNDDATVTVNDVLPTITVDKSADPASVPETGGNVTFTVVVHNTSVEEVTLTSLTDSIYGDLNGQGTCATGGVIPAGGTYTCAFTVFVSGNVGWPETNTITATATDDENNEATDSDTATVDFADVLPTLEVEKTANPTSIGEPGGMVSFTVVVTNTSGEPVTLASLVDSPYGNLNGQGTCSVPQTLAANGGSYTCLFTALVSGDAGEVKTDLVTATAHDDENNNVSANDEANVTITDVLPSVSLDKSASPTTLPEPGGLFTFTLTITNNSVETVTITALTDTNALSAECLALVGTTLAPGASASCTYTVSHTDAGSYANTASVTVQDNEGNAAGDSDDETVTVTDTLPSVDLDKSASPASLPEPGGTFTFTLTITNNSVETVTITALTDTNALSAECLALIGTTLAPGASASCTYTVSHTDAGSYANTASVTVQDDEGNSASDSDDETAEVTDVAPSVTLDKSASPASLPEPGGIFTFTLAITNNSVETVTITALTDTNALSAECLALVGTTLAPGQSVSCQYSVTHADAGQYTNTASVTVEDDEQNPASNSDNETVAVADVKPSIDVDKTANPTSVDEPGGLVTFTVVVTNNSIEPVTLDSLTDDVHGNLDGLGSCATGGSIAANGGTYTCTFTATVSGNAGDFETDIVTAHASDNEGNDAADDDDATVTIADVPSSIAVTKTPDADTINEPGADVVYTIVVENTSAVDDVTITSVVDDQFGDISAGCLPALPFTLAPGETITCTVSEFIEGNAGDTHTNTATAYGVDDDDNDLSASDDATVTIADVQPSIAVEKDVDPASVPETGGTASYLIAVTNNSVEDVTLTTLTDSIYGNLDGLGDCNVPAVIAFGDTYTCTFSAFVSGNVGAPETDVVTATAIDDELNTATDDDDAILDFTDVLPAIAVEKTATPDNVDEPGDTVNFTVTVANTSGEPVTLTSLTDDVYGNLDGQGDCVLPQTIAVGDSYTCTFSGAVNGDAFSSHTDVATATANDDELNDASAFDDATVTVNDVLPGITVEKTATPGNVDEPGDTVSFTVTVTNDSVEPVTLTSLVDDVYGDLNGQGDCALPAVIAVGDSFTCTFPGAVSGNAFTSHTDTVTATAEDNELNEATASDSATVTVNDVLPTVTLDKSVDPAELLVPGGDFTYTLTITNTSVEPVTITALTDTSALSAECLALIGTTLGVGESASCTYIVTHTEPGVHDNTASVTVEDDEGNPAGATDDASVFVANPVIALDKIGPVYAFSGDAITFTYEVSNAGNVPLGNISVTDDKCGNATYVSGDTNDDGKLDLDEVWTFTCAYTPPFTSLSTLTNVATATGEYKDAQASATDDFTLFPFTLRKKVFLYWNSPANTVPYNQPDNTPFTVNMYQGSTLAATFTISQNSPQRLWLSAGTYNFQEVSLPPGYLSGYNLFTFTTGQSYPDWTFPNIITFDLAIDKTGPAGAFKGDTVTYNYTVTNAGPASVAPVVSDNKCSPLVYLGGDTDSDGLVDPGETWKYKCNYTVTTEPGTYITNKATVDDVFEPTPGWHLGGDRSLANNTDSWTFRVQWKGCTVNYWKANTSLWPSPYTTTTLVTGVFTVPSSYFTSGKLDLNADAQADNLLKALNYSTSGSTTVNGAARNLLRAAVAALFNEVKYGNLYPPYATKTALISAVNSALATRNANTMMSLANTLNKWNGGVCP